MDVCVVKTISSSQRQHWIRFPCTFFIVDYDFLRFIHKTRQTKTKTEKQFSATDKMRTSLLQASINTLWALNACAQHTIQQNIHFIPSEYLGRLMPFAHFLQHAGGVSQSLKVIFSISYFGIRYIFRQFFFSSSHCGGHNCKWLISFHEACLSNYSFSPAYLSVTSLCSICFSASLFVWWTTFSHHFSPVFFPPYYIRLLGWSCCVAVVFVNNLEKPSENKQTTWEDTEDVHIEYLQTNERESRTKLIFKRP